MKGIVEIDTRHIEGGRGEVVWTLAGSLHTVEVMVDGEAVATIVTHDGIEAREAFQHPFARQSTPDVFGRLYEEVAA